MGLNPEEMDKLDNVISTRRRIKRGTALFNTGDKFTSLYAVRSGFFKTCVTTADGRDQVTGFQMTGEIIGMDGIVSDRHSCDAIALEDAEVCVMPFDQVEELSREFTTLQHHVHKIMSREIVRDHSVIAAAGQHACRRTAGGVSAESGATAARPGFLAVRVDPADDPRRNRQLPGHEAGDSQHGRFRSSSTKASSRSSSVTCTSRIRTPSNRSSTPRPAADTIPPVEKKPRQATCLTGLFVGAQLSSRDRRCGQQSRGRSASGTGHRLTSKGDIGQQASSVRWTPW